jgi:hypothetical protein
VRDDVTDEIRQARPIWGQAWEIPVTCKYMAALIYTVLTFGMLIFISTYPITIDVKVQTFHISIRQLHNIHYLLAAA